MDHGLTGTPRLAGTICHNMEARMSSDASELLTPDDLEEADLLLMSGNTRLPLGDLIGRPWLKWPKIPISKLIRWLDGGSYSHATIVSVGDGGQILAWDHGENWRLGPRPLGDATKGTLRCDVFRFAPRRDNPKRFPTNVIVGPLDNYIGNDYGMRVLLVVGILAVIRRSPKREFWREVLFVVLEQMFRILDLHWDEDLDGEPLICTAVPGLAHHLGGQAMSDDGYELEIKLGRGGAEDILTASNDPHAASRMRLRRRLEQAAPSLSRAFESLDAEIWRTRASEVDMWRKIGSVVPPNFVGVSDLEFSRSLYHVGQLELPARASKPANRRPRSKRVV